ncbi:aspartate carbamoyltransferase regulatory subunit [Candidatus Woesearchaeota archaeon]|nr:aspartate carbamoyltransferase regulatory subunit [Candidatus Woesearchaeota archaeon]
MEDRVYKVYRIKNGTVIDHIPQGKGHLVMKILKLHKEPSDNFIALGVNLKSKKGEFKDLVKIEDKELSEQEINKITLIAPKATMNIIRNGKITKKYKVKLPKNITGIMKCSNPNCVINNEHDVSTKFIMIQEHPLRVRCRYCERVMESKDIYVL